MRRFCLALSLALFAALPEARAQDSQTLADIRQELTVLNVEIQKLRRELSTTGAAMTPASGSSLLERVDAIEAELQGLTARTEALSHRIERIVEDGTNRIGDLEFRLVELEGGDVSKLGETSTLGGVPPATGAPETVRPAPPATELAVGEQADFDAAAKALSDGDPARAIQLLAAFNETYPGSPLAARADLLRGRALDAQGDTREAARAYLASFTAAPTGDAAPEALYELGAALGRLGQTSQACVTLAEVGVRFPNADAVTRARAEMTALGCG